MALELAGRRTGKPDRTDIGVQLALLQRLGHALRRNRRDFDLVRVIGWIDRQLVPAFRHRNDGERDDDAEYAAGFHDHIHESRT